MYRLLFAGIIFFILIFGSLTHAPEVIFSQSIVSHATPTPTAIPTPTVTPTPIPALPLSINIPKIGVNTQIDPVGIDSIGRMDVPTDVTHVGWYNLGFRPGEWGSAVIDGHYDTVTGAPAVFYHLASLTKGDKIYITDQNNKVYSFTVEQVAVYDFNNAPLQQIFHTTDKPRLNLITCDGIWDRQTHNYLQRAIIYSVMDE